MKPKHPPAPEHSPRPTAREKRDRHLGEAARRASEIAHHGSRVAAIRAKIKKARDRGRDCANHVANLRKAEQTLAAKKKAHAYATRAAGKLDRAALRADAALAGIKLPRQRATTRVLTKAEQRSAQKAQAREERAMADRRRHLRSLGLDDDLRLPSANRDHDVLDTTKGDPNGVRRPRTQAAERMFENRGKDFSNHRVDAIERLRTIFEQAGREAPMSGGTYREKVDTSTAGDRALRGASALVDRDTVRREVRELRYSLLEARIVYDLTWDYLARDGVPRSELGRLFVEGLDGAIKALGIPDPDANPGRSRMRWLRDDGTTDIRKRSAA